MVRIPLDDTQARRLEQAALRATDREPRGRLQVGRIAHRGRTLRHIAADLAVTPRTVRTRRNASLRGGLAALVPREAKGQPPAIPPRFASATRRRALEVPAEQGRDRASWAHAGLADHPAKAEAGQSVLLGRTRPAL